jgi:hypothetical protein
LRIHHRGAGGRFSHIFLLVNLPSGCKKRVTPRTDHTDKIDM